MGVVFLCFLVKSARVERVNRWEEEAEIERAQQEMIKENENKQKKEKKKIFFKTKFQKMFEQFLFFFLAIWNRFYFKLNRKRKQFLFNI